MAGRLKSTRAGEASRAVIRRHTRLSARADGVIGCRRTDQAVNAAWRHFGGKRGSDQTGLRVGDDYRAMWKLAADLVPEGLRTPHRY